MHATLTVLALWAAGLGAAAQFAKLAVGFEALGAAYPEAGAALGLAVSSLSVMGLIFGLSGGVAVARLGARRALVTGLLLGAAMSALQALSPALPLFLATRVVEGASHIAIAIAAPTMMAELAGARLRPAAMTLWSTFFGVAFALAALGGPALIARYGLPGLFGLHAAYMAAMAGVLAALLPAIPRAPAAATGPGQGWIRQHVALYRAPHLSAPALGWLFYTLTFVALLTLLPRVMGPEMPRWLPAALPLASIGAALTVGTLLLSTLSAVSVVMVSFALSAAAALAWIVTGGAPPVALALFLCLGLVQAASFAAVPELARSPAERALSNGAVAQMGNLGNLAGTPLMLAALGAGGGTAALGLVLAAYLAGLAVHAALARVRAQPISDRRAT